MNKYVLLGIFVLVFIIGLAVIFTNQSVSLGQVFRGMSDLNPRVMSIIALPVIAVLFGAGVYLHKKNEERMWKNAVKKTRASRQNTSD